MRWVGHVAHVGEGRSARRVLLGKPEGMTPLGTDGRILTWSSRGGMEGTDQIYMAQKRDRLLCMW